MRSRRSAQPAPRTRRADPGDAACCARIATESLPTPWSEDLFRRELERERTRALVVQTDEGVAGFVVGWRAADEVDILTLAVDPAHRGKGMGRGMLADYLRVLREDGVSQVRLEVRASNARALRLYRQAGMERSGERRGYYSDGEDALIYGVALS